MATVQTEQQQLIIRYNYGSTDQVNRIESTFILRWSLQEFVVNTLNQLSALILYDHLNRADLKNKLNQDITNLISALINLPCTSEIRNRKIDESFAEISNDDKNKLIEHLLANRNKAILYSDSVGLEERKLLAQKNTKLISDFSKINCNLSSNHEVFTSNNKRRQREENLNSKRMKLNNDLMRLTRENEMLKLELQETRQFDMRNNIQPDIIQSLVPPRSGFMMNYEVYSPKSFLSPKERNLKGFFFQRALWFLTLKSQINKGKLIIGLILTCRSKKPDWFMNAEIELTLLNRQFQDQSKTVTICHIFNKNKSVGLEDFIDREDLLNQERGFVRRNKIAVRVHIKSTSLMESNYSNHFSINGRLYE